MIGALFSYRSARPQSRTVARFCITPFDTGLATLKSDKYLQLAASAQVDCLIKTALIRDMLANRYGFVNASQLVRFLRPIRLFSRVKMKFKNGPLTIPPAKLLGTFQGAKPLFLQCWDDALAAVPQ